MRIFGPAFLADCAGRPKPTTKATHAHNMQRSIRRPSATVASMRSLRATCGTGSTICRSRERLRANRSLTVQSSLRKHAEYLGLRPKGSNPCRGGGARLHDLRHSHASHAIMNGESLRMTRRLLGHRRATITTRYTHPDDATVERGRRACGGSHRVEVQSRCRTPVIVLNKPGTQPS